MPDGTRLPAERTMAAPAEPSHGPAPRWERAAGLALALHLGVALPVVLALEHAPQPTTIAGVELAVPAEAAAEAAGEDRAAEEVAQAAPEAESLAAIPPDTAAAFAPPEPIPPPQEALSAETPPVDAPPETVAASLPEPLQALAPADDPPLAEELPTPPPPLAPPPRPARARAVQQAARAAPAPSGGAPAEAPAAAAPAPAPPAATAPGPSRRPSAGYVGALLAALERHKDYPTSARHRRAEGVALLRFAMRRDGSVSAWRIERSTGDPELDAAVGQMVRRASPLPAPPGDLPGDPIELVVPVRFVLR